MDNKVVKPHKSVGPVVLGMTREEVRELFSEPPNIFRKSETSASDTFAFFEGSIQVFFGGEADTAEYIEVTPSGYGSFSIDGFDVFATPSEKLIGELDKTYDLKIEEGGSSVILEGQDVSLWRLDPDATYFDSIGIGVEGYYGKVA